MFMIRYVGLDVHKRFVEACILDDQGNVLYRGRADCEREALERFARRRLKKTDRVALEATTNTWPIVEILRPFVAAIVVGNPLKTKAIAEAKIKTDKIDAEVLAQLLRCDYLPDVWQPDDETQVCRTLVTHRTGLMAGRGRHKNRIQSLLAGLLIRPPCKILWTKVGMAWLETVELPTTQRLVLDSELRQLAKIENELAVLDRELVARAQREPRVQLLMTLPGIDYVVALGLLAALGDINRFRDGDHAASYLGLAPSTRQSANRCYHGHITKAGSSQARWLLTQGCQHVARHPGPLGAFYRRLAKRKNRQVAIMAVARKLVTVAYLMLKNNEPYRYAKPELMAHKFAFLNRAMNGSAPRRKHGFKAQARVGLTAVYAHAGLPPVVTPDELPNGERRMLTERKLNDFVGELYAPAASRSRKSKQSTSSVKQTKGGAATAPQKS
jgi:transposase